MYHLHNLMICLLLAGCAAFEPEPPTPFEEGHEVSPPPGCIDYRARGGQC